MTETTTSPPRDGQGQAPAAAGHGGTGQGAQASQEKAAEARRKAFLLWGTAAVVFCAILAIHHFRTQQQTSQQFSQAVSIAQPQPQSPQPTLPLFSAPAPKDQSAAAQEEVGAELSRLKEQVALVQARTALLKAQQELAALQVPAAAQDQRALLVAFQPAAAGGKPAGEQAEAPSAAGVVQAMQPSTYAEVVKTTPKESPEPYVLRKGTFLDAILVNKLVTDNAASPVLAMVDRPYYDPLSRALLIPAGTRVLGKAEAVKFQTASRLAITFDTFQFPNGTSLAVKPDEQALEGLGIFGLQDHVNRHTARVLFTAGLVGLLTGWNASQIQGNAYAGAYSGSDLMRLQANQSLSQTAEGLLSPFLNAVPTITVDEGHRMKIWISRDIPLPLYREAPGE
ncbi:MAG: TrbI/VirB10 family protein [Halothiobacillaceae bacterium]